MTTNRCTLYPLVRATLFLLAAGAVSYLAASGPAIGVAMADGSFQVDHSQVWGNATLFDGSVVQTGPALSRLKFSTGTRISLASESRATVHQGRLVLESGMGQLESAPGFEVESRTLRISAAEPGTVARIRLENSPAVMVATLRGSVKVTNAEGLLVAKVEAGNSLDFDPQAAGASAPTKASGCLIEKDGQYMVVEQTANITLRVSGPGLADELGNRVEVTGIAETINSGTQDASQMITVAGVKRIAKGGCNAVARKLGASAGSGRSGGTNASTATAAGGIGKGTIAIIGGVATAATVGGLAAVGSLPGQSQSTPSASR